MSLEDFIAYIDNAIDGRPHTDSSWIDEQGNRISTDVGYAIEWWDECMKPELLRVLGDRRADNG